jgi:hypothetical protein
MDRPSEGRYAKQSRKRVNTGTRDSFQVGQRTREKALRQPTLVKTSTDDDV